MKSGPVKQQRSIILILLAITLLGCIFRFYQLGDKSLWIDELATIANAREMVDLQAFLGHTKGDDLPRLYSLLLKFWMMFGETESFLRSLSVLFGILCIPATYILSRLFFDVRTSLAASFLTAASPFLLIYDREIRMYSMFAFLSLLSSYTFVRMLREEKGRIFTILYTVINVLNVYTHYYAFMTIGAQWLYLILRNRRHRDILWKWLAANSVILLFFLVRLPAFISDVAYFAPWAIPRERFPFIFGKEFVEFFYIFYSFIVGQTLLPWNPAGIIVVIAMACCLFYGFRKGLSYSKDDLYIVLLIFAPIVVGIVFRISLPRYFTFIAPLLFMIAASGFFLVPKKAAIISALIIVFGWGYGISNYYLNKEFHIMAHVDPWKEVGQFMKENIRPEDTVYTVGLGVVSIRHYYGKNIPGYSGEEAVERARSLDHHDRTRIWLIFTHYEDYQNWLNIRKLLQENYEITMEKKWAHDPDARMKARFFRKHFLDDRIVIDLFERRNNPF